MVVSSVSLEVLRWRLRHLNSCSETMGARCHWWMTKVSSCPCGVGFGALVKGASFHADPDHEAHSGSRTGVLIRPVRAVLHSVPAQDPRDTAAVPEHSWSAIPPPRATGWAGSHCGDKSQREKQRSILGSPGKICNTHSPVPLVWGDCEGSPAAAERIAAAQLIHRLCDLLARLSLSSHLLNC